MASLHDPTTLSSSDFSYDVFLSFRGGTRYAFTDHLYRALLRHGIHTFRDDEDLRKGDEIRPSLLRAIESSRVSMVVLCEDYASSTWCLDELAKIVECYEKEGKPVLAIFYKVEISDVRKQRNSYEAAMVEHEKRFGKESEKVRAWRKALSRVCDLSGEYCEDHMYESKLIDKIVKDTSAKLPAMPLQIKHIVGLDSRYEQVKPLFDIGSSDAVCMLGVYGPGGIGKTTFAMYIYNKIRHQFEAASFLANVREKSNKTSNGLEDLQRTLLSEMGEETETMMGSTFRGGSEIKRRLGRKRVFLVLDDIDAVKQLESLAGGRDWFGPGSMIIITARDTDVLHKHDVEIKKYKMEELNYNDSLELFCWYAFNRSRPAEIFEDISRRTVRYAKGIPLALRVIGSNLKGGSLEEWEIELDKYRSVPDSEIQSVLEISYNSLSDLDRKIFLDIACFFKGERWEYVKRILYACDLYPVIRVFVGKCLVTVDENGCLDMHDLIQDMGREIVRKESPSNPGGRSRLWSHIEVLQVLKENLGSSTIEGIMLHPPRLEEVDCWINAAFEKMKNLRILIVRNTIFAAGPSHLPNSLRLLDWKGYPSKSLPPDFYPRRIVDFKLPYSSLILTLPFQVFDDLTFINFSQCQFLTQIPDLSGAKNLRVLTLDGCHKLAKFDKSVGFMPNLVYLSASECSVLKSFVPKMYLPSLEVLSFNFCSKLEYFPDVMQKMDKPLKVHLINTAIKEFPKSIGNLTGLEYIDMSICKGLKDLSSSFLLLPKLVSLIIDGCSQLGESFIRFKESHSVANGCPNLKKLHLSEANLSYGELYTVLQVFPKLEDLKVSHNGFVSLPECIKGSLHLKSLDVSFCQNLKDIPKLPLNIQKVDARNCRSLTSEASSMLWSKVSDEIQRIQVVMPKTEIPEWFDYVCTGEIPLFWARRKFPIVALAFVFRDVKETGTISNIFSELFPGIMRSHSVSLHLFLDSQEICVRDYHYFNVGDDHVLFCDLRVLFNDEEWQGLDASLGEEWKAVQVQYDSDMILSHWGVYVYKQQTNWDDIRFKHHNSSRDYIMPPSSLVPKGSPEQKMKHMIEQQMKHMIESFNPRDICNEFLPLLESEDMYIKSAHVFLRSWRNAKAEIKMDASASDYGASLKQAHEESVDDVVRVSEMIKENVPKDLAELYPEDIDSTGQTVERLLRARVELMKEQGQERLDLGIPIILDDWNPTPSRRWWGALELKVGDPFFKPVLRKLNQLSWAFWNSNEGLRHINGEIMKPVPIVLLKCQRPWTREALVSGNEESLEEGQHDPQLQALLRRIEEDAMRWNKSHGKLKASIVHTDEPFSADHLWEALIYRRLLVLGNWGKFASAFKITPYGKLKAEDDPWLYLKLCCMLLALLLYFIILCLSGFIGILGLVFYRIPLVRKLFVGGGWLVKKILEYCKYSYGRIGKIMRIKEKEL